jgi:hypothetical protein
MNTEEGGCVCPYDSSMKFHNRSWRCSGSTLRFIEWIRFRFALFRYTLWCTWSSDRTVSAVGRQVHCCTTKHSYLCNITNVWYIFRCSLYLKGYYNSVVGIPTGYGLDDRGVGVRVPVGSRIFSSTLSRPALGPTQPPIQWVPGAVSPGVRRQGREADHSASTSADVKKMWIYTYTFMA